MHKWNVYVWVCVKGRDTERERLCVCGLLPHCNIELQYSITDGIQDSGH